MNGEARSMVESATHGMPAHAVLDVAHRPGALPGIAPRWYLVGCAIYDVYIGALCYLPILKR